MKTNIGVTAQSLWHMNILSNNAVTISYKGMPISIPKPEAYALHKMVINNERKNKQEKDREAVKGIWPYLNASEIEHIKEKLSKKELVRIEQFKQSYLI